MINQDRQLSEQRQLLSTQLRGERRYRTWRLTGKYVAQCTISDPVLVSLSTTSSLITRASHFFRYSVSSWRDKMEGTVRRGQGETDSIPAQKPKTHDCATESKWTVEKHSHSRPRYLNVEELPRGNVCVCSQHCREERGTPFAQAQLITTAAKYVHRLTS